MISYVECLGGEGTGHSMSTRCWNRSPDEERDELLPRKMAALQPKTEGSLRRRLLSARIHQHHNAIMALKAGGAGRPETPPVDKIPLPPHFQYPGSSPWHCQHHYPPRPYIHPSLTPEAHGKQPLLSGCPVLTQWGRTGSCPLNPEPRPGYTLPVPSPFIAPASFREPEVPPQYRYQPRQKRKTNFFHFRARRGRSSKMEATQTTPLLHKAGDRDSKWSVHYTTQKPKQGVLFIHGKRRSGSADDLQACNELTQHGYSRPNCFEPCLPSPSSSGLDQSHSSTTRSRWRDKSRKMSSAFSDEDERFILNNTRPMTPLVLNPIHHTSCWDGFAPAYEPRVNMEMEVPPRLPTPEERMRQQAQAVGADIVPINITGESFDRQASFRRTGSNTDSLSQRHRNLSRRKTVTRLPSDVKGSLNTPPGQFSTVGRSASCASTLPQKHTVEQIEAEEKVEATGAGRSTSRRIRAPRGEGLSSLMAALTSTKPVASSSEVHSLPRMATNSSLNSDASCNSVSYRTLSTSSSCCQDMQGFPSDLHPLLPFDPTARVIPQSPSSSSSSSLPISSSLPSSPSRILPSDWSYPVDKPLNKVVRHNSPSSHYLSSSSIADSESQFSCQTQDDQPSTHNGASYSEGTWSYRSLSPSSSIHSSQTGSDWTSITQDLSCVSAEGWNCDPLLSSGRSTPCHADSNSVCSEKRTCSPLLNRDRRKHSASSLHLRSSTRSISLRKSKRPPPPPARSDSLRRRPGRSKPSHPSSRSGSPRLDHTTRRTPTSSPQRFHDPWVPRTSPRRRQSGVLCGTVTTFEPLGADCQADTSVSPSENLPPVPGHSHARQFTPGPPGSEEDGLRYTPTPLAAPPSAGGLQRLASPSSGYSSQSNTPTPGTPVSSPVAPSSPLTAFPLQPASPLSTLQSVPLSPSVSSLPKTRCRGEGRPKPLVPERKSSLLSSLSSSFSSTSSLSSCTSSDSSARNPLLPPPPPPPPPLPECNSPVFYSPIKESSSAPPACSKPSVVPPPPPPPSSLPSSLVMSPTPPPPPPPPLPSLSLPPPPPPPPLPSPMPSSSTPPPLPPLASSCSPTLLPPAPPLPSSFTTTPPLALPPFSRPPPPPYSYAIRQNSHPATLSNRFSTPPSSLPPPPPPPPLPTLPPLHANPLPQPGACKSPNRDVKVLTDPCLVVTAQALQGVRLRSVRNQGGLLASISHLASAAPTAPGQPSKESHPGNGAQANTNPDDLANANVNFVGNASSGVSADADANQLRHNLDCGSQKRTKSDEKKPSVDGSFLKLHSVAGSPTCNRCSQSKLINGETLQEIKYNQQEKEHPCTYATLTNDPNSSPRVKMPCGADKNNSDVAIENLSLPQDKMSPGNKLSKQAEKQGNNKDVWQTDSSYWTLSGTKGEPRRESKAKVNGEDDGKGLDTNHSAARRDFKGNTDFKQDKKVLKAGSPRKICSPEKPLLPKKPDLCILGLIATPDTREGSAVWKSNEQITECFPEPNQSQFDKTGPVPDRATSTHKLNPASLPLNATAADVSLPLPASSPKKQKPSILHKKPDLSFTSPWKTKPSFPTNKDEASPGTSRTCSTTGITGVSMTQSNAETPVGAPKAGGTFDMAVGTMENFGASGTCDTKKSISSLEPTSIYRHCEPSGFIGKQEFQSIKVASNTFDNTRSVHGSPGTPHRTSESCHVLGNSWDRGSTSPQKGPTCTQPLWEDGKTNQRLVMRSSLTEDQEEDEERSMKTRILMMVPTARKKDRKRRSCRQLLMMSPATEPTPSSSSSSSSSLSSSSSEDEREDAVKERVAQTRVTMSQVCYDDTTDSESSCTLVGQSKYSLSSALSSDSLQVELSLPDLLIQEPGEGDGDGGQEGTEERDQEGKEAAGQRDDMFGSVSADQLFVSGRPRTTDDLFAVIHRSKKKMLARKYSEEDRCHTSSSSSSSSSPVSPSDSHSGPLQSAFPKSQRSLRSESFKALLLRKGSRSDSASRISAVERLRLAAAPVSESCDLNLTLDVPPSPTSPCGQSLTLRWRRRDLTPNHLLLSSQCSSPFFFLSSPLAQPRALTPPCSASRRYAARYRLYAAPMTAIFEAEGEQEEEEEVFVDSAGAVEGALSQRLVEIS